MPKKFFADGDVCIFKVQVRIVDGRREVKEPNLDGSSKGRLLSNQLGRSFRECVSSFEVRRHDLLA